MAKDRLVYRDDPIISGTCFETLSEMYAMKTLCEWNPARDEIAWTIGEIRIGCHEPAALSLGRYGEWHLCVRCAGLSAFAHFRDRSTLAALLYATGQAKLRALKGTPHPRAGRG